MNEKKEENHRLSILKRLWRLVSDFIRRDPVRAVGLGILLTATIVILILSIIFPPIFAIIPAAAFISSPALATGLTSLLIGVFGGIAMVLWNLACDGMKLLFPPKDASNIEINPTLKSKVNEDVPIVTDQGSAENKVTQDTLISSEALSLEEKALEEEIKKLSRKGKKVKDEISAKITEGKHDEAIHLMKEQLTQLSAFYKKFALLCHPDKVSPDRKAWAERVFKTLVKTKDSLKTNWEQASIDLRSDLNEPSAAWQKECSKIKELLESLTKLTDEFPKKLDDFKKEYQEKLDKLKVEMMNEIQNYFSENESELDNEEQFGFWNSEQQPTDETKHVDKQKNLEKTESEANKLRSDSEEVVKRVEALEQKNLKNTDKNSDEYNSGSKPT